MASAPILHKHQPRLVPQQRLKEYICYRQVFVCYPRVNQSRFYDNFGPFSPKITIVRSKCFFKLMEQQAWHIKKSTIYVNLGIGHFQKYHSHQNRSNISSCIPGHPKIEPNWPNEKFLQYFEEGRKCWKGRKGKKNVLVA